MELHELSGLNTRLIPDLTYGKDNILLKYLLIFQL